MSGIKKLSTRIINKHATAAIWNTKTNFYPLQGETIVYDPGYDSTDGKIYKYERFKIGDGTHNVTELPFANEQQAVVTKTTKGLLIIYENTLCIQLKRKDYNKATHHASSNCCGCRMCTDLCPRYLLGYPIEPHKVIAAVSNKIEDNKTFKGAFYCSDCGVCRTIACTQNLMPSLVFQRVKSELAKEGMRAEAHSVSTPRALREYRKIPVKRIINRLGISKYFREEYEVKEIPLPSKVFIGIKQHIGAPAVCAVSVGDKVALGQVIATAPEKALGTNIHSSVSGTVESLTEAGITITL